MTPKKPSPYRTPNPLDARRLKWEAPPSTGQAPPEAFKRAVAWDAEPISYEAWVRQESINARMMARLRAWDKTEEAKILKREHERRKAKKAKLFMEALKNDARRKP